jgi:hypothetical protein
MCRMHDISLAVDTEARGDNTPGIVLVIHTMACLLKAVSKPQRW